MGKYGKAAIRAWSLLTEGSESNPSAAWKLAASEIFPHSPSSQEKGCPRGAFLGLCSAGWVLGVPEGTYTRSRENRRYAEEAARLLCREPSLAEKPDQLWAKVMHGEEKVENSQMDIVISLWKAGAIVKSGI